MKYMKISPTKTVITVVVVGLGAAAGLYLLYANKQNDTAEVRVNAEQKTEKLNKTGDPKKLEKAKDELEALAKTETDPETQLTYLKGAMDAAAASGNYVSATKLAKKIEAIEKTDLSAANYAAYAEGLGDYEVAVKYFGIAAERSTGRAKQDYEVMRKNAEAKVHEN